MSASDLVVHLEVREVAPEDLPELQWSGGPAHLRVLAETWQRAQDGDVALLCLQASNRRLVAVGGVDLVGRPGVGTLWMLAVRPSWQSLGVGTLLIGALERAAGERGLAEAELSVEDDNPDAARLYRRLGYAAVGRRQESWPLDDGSLFRTMTTVLRRTL